MARSDRGGDRRDRGGDGEPGDLLLPAAAPGEQRRRIGADAEERRMAERHDAGEAEDEVERQREQHHQQHLAAERHAVGKEKEGGDGEEPRNGFPDVEVMPSRHEGDRPRAGVRHRVRGGGGVSRGHKAPPA